MNWMLWIGISLFLLLSSCFDKKEVQMVAEHPKIYPDYTNIFVPPNIAPLNFMVRDSIEKIEVVVSGENGSMKAFGTDKINFSVPRFRKLTEQHKGDTLFVSVSVRKDGKWTRYKPFYWFVTNETIDPYLTYRLIEPGYEVYNKISIKQRNLTNFDEKVMADNNLVDKACMNCHITNKHRPDQSFFHIRHQKGGTILAKGGKLRKVDTRTNSTLSAGVYGNWHPSGRFIAFSTNVIIPEFYSRMDKRMEVYDTTSDLMILDIDENEVFTAPQISISAKFESFPEFSADGRKLFFCVADSVNLPDNYKELKYSLCSIEFNEFSRTFGGDVDTLFSAHANNQTVSLPKASPDGKYLMFTVFDYGTFPIWHNEAVLYLIDLTTGTINNMPIVNDKKYSNSYHSWSVNSRWFVFASKRDNGMYGKPYFSYIQDDGTETKPFVLPQKDPEFYDYFYKSYNIPELLEQEVSFNAIDVEKVFRQVDAEKVKFIETNRGK